MLSAKNFITGNFISDQRPASIFTLLKKTKGFEDDNILLKSNISLKDASYFAIDDMDIKILEKLKQINWRFLLSRYPSMVEKEEDEIFVYNKTDTKSLKRKLTDAYLIPSKIKADTEITKLKIEKFLLHKVKRQRAVKSTER